MRRASKVDKNQPEIVKAFRDMGATVLVTSQLKNAFDLLVGYKGQLYIVEVKDGKLPPSKRKLTEGECACRFNFNAVGVHYHIVESVDDVVNLLK